MHKLSGVAWNWDETKRTSNIAKHGVDFDVIRKFDWEDAFTREDSRSDYGEVRFVSIGPVSGRPYVAVWVFREQSVRLISLRKANAREAALYEKARKER